MTTKAKAPKEKTSKPKTKTTKAAAPKGNRHERREKALALRGAGKSFKEIAETLGYANAGAANNAYRAARDAAAKAT